MYEIDIVICAHDYYDKLRMGPFHVQLLWRSTNNVS